MHAVQVFSDANDLRVFLSQALALIARPLPGLADVVAVEDEPRQGILCAHWRRD
jgi:hypothetical protein